MTITARQAVSLALLTYTAGVFMLALFPINTLTYAELFDAALAVVAGIGMIANLIPVIKLPGQQYAYLMVGLAGLATLGCYLVTSEDPYYVQIRAAFLLLAGAVGGYGAWLATDKDL